MNVVELQRALRQLRCSGLAAALKLVWSKRRPRNSRRSISCPGSCRTSCSAGRIASSNAE